MSQPSMKRRSIKRLLPLMLSGLLVSSLGCGGSSNNDQGTSFLAFGWFTDSTGDTGATGSIAPLATDKPTIPTENTGAADGIIGDGNAVFAYLGLQNRLTTQFVRLVRIDCRYNVPGASPALQIPDDAANFSTVMGPAPTDDAATGGDEVLGNVSYSGFEILSPDLISFLNVNRNLLPELPFRMDVICNATGVSQAGDTLTTNDLSYFIQFVDSAECCTGEGQNGGFQTGPGSGGTITFDETPADSTGGAVLTGESQSSATATPTATPAA